MVHVADFSVWSWGVGKCAIESSESQKVEVEGEIAGIVMIMMICLVARRLKLTRLALRILEARSFRKEEICLFSSPTLPQCFSTHSLVLRRLVVNGPKGCRQGWALSRSIFQLK